MNAILPAALDGELLSSSAMVPVYGTTHPLNAVAGHRIHCHVRAGASITEILLEALSHKPGAVLRRDLIVRINDHVIPEENWSRVRVKEGAVVTFVPRLQGDSLRSVLGVVVAVAALVVAPYLAPGIISGLGAIGVTVGASTASALAAGGIILAGSLALNALFPVARPAAQDSIASTSLNSIQGAQNQANPFGPIPVVLGRHRQSPYYAAKPYTEIVGNDQYLRLLFCMGYGPLALADFRIGETPLASFSDYQIEVRQGFASDGPVTLYPGSVDEVALSITLVNGGDPPGTAGDNGVWNSQTTAAETDEISLDFTAPQGMFQIDEKSGNLESWSTIVNVQYRTVGAPDWLDAPNVLIPRSNDPTRVGLVFAVTRGQYDVRSRKLYGDGNSDKIKDEVVWTALRSIKRAAPITFPKPLALVALRIKASDQLSGVVNTFNCSCSSLVKAWNGASWDNDAPSQIPSDLFRHVLQGPANARPVPDSAIDIENLQGWWVACRAKEFRLNQVINSVGSVYDKLCEIAAAGRAVPTFIDGKWGVVWDRPTDPIVQHFTPRNSWGFQGQRAYAQQPHGWRVSFINEDNGFTQDERIVYDDGFDETNATLFEGIEFPGVTDPRLIWIHGRFHIAQSRLRPETITLNVGWEHLVCTRGDRVRVTHDVMLIGLASGRVKSIDGQVVTFDEQVTIEAGKTYGMQFRVAADARVIDRSVDAGTPAGDYFSLTLVGDLTGVKADTLFGFGETNRESANYRVKGIANQKDLIATLTLVDDAPEISNADTGTVNRLANLTPYRRPILTPSRGVV